MGCISNPKEVQDRAIALGMTDGRLWSRKTKMVP